MSLRFLDSYFVSTDYTDCAERTCVICGLRNSFLSLSHQVGEAWIGTKLAEVRVDTHEREADGVLAFRLRQPAKGVVEVTEPRVDDRDLVSRHPILVTLGDDLIQNRLGFFTFSDRREYVRALGVRGRRVPRETALLFERRQRLVVHAFQFVRPTKNRMRRHRARIELERLARLRHSLVKLACQKQYVRNRRCDHCGLRRDLTRAFDLRIRLVVTSHCR